MSSTKDPILDAIQSGSDLVTILLKLGAMIVGAIQAASGKSTEEVLKDIQVEVTATNKAQASAEAAERAEIEGG